MLSQVVDGEAVAGRGNREGAMESQCRTTNVAEFDGVWPQVAHI